MDAGKLIERLKCPKIHSCPIDELYPSCKACQKGVKQDAATALSTLQAENEKLRAERDDLKARWEKYQPKEHWETLNELCKNLHDELEQVKKERDAAVWDLKYLGDCVVCKYNNVPCPREDAGHKTCFQWRGQKED